MVMVSGYVGKFVMGGFALLLAASPTSTNYVLPSFDIGSGGTDASSSTSYQLNGIAGSQGGAPHTSTSYSIKDGLNPTQDATVPPAPTLSNPANYYDRLLLEIDTGGNSSDTRYLVAISDDSFTTTSYVQLDNSIGTSYSLATFRTYASYGGVSGFLILGLTPSTTYTVKIKAIRGDFTESAYGPTTSGVATAGQTISFGVSTTLTGTPPFNTQFSSLVPGSVSSADADINIDVTTNAMNGGTVYIQSSNGALFSASESFSISSSSTDLALALNGYGAQVISVTQSSGGPFIAEPPFDGVSDVVGQISSALSEILSSSTPVTGASASVRLKAKADVLTPATTDFSDVVTVIAAMNY